jgi:glycosyltransferase involved in cell wall biosynthesis
MTSTTILFLPNVEDVRTSERTPAMLRLLRMHHGVVGERFPCDAYVYDSSRPKPPRYLVYLIGQVLAAVRGVRLAKERGADLVFCETPHHALVGLWIARMRGVPCVWDSHGNALLFARSTSRGRVYIFLTSGLDRFLARRVDLLLTVSRKDAAAYEAMGAPPSRVQVVPTSVDVTEVDRQLARGSGGQHPGVGSPAGRVLIFFGNFGYRPNAEALQFISDHVAPHLERSGIRFEIRVAGRDLPPLSLHPSIRWVGYVDNLPAWIRQADVCIVPVFRGVGILTKVLDVMAARTPVVVSTMTLDGIPEIQDGVHAVVARSPEEFPGRVRFALEHSGLMGDMAERARHLIEERYDWTSQGARLEEMLSKLSHGRGGA